VPLRAVHDDLAIPASADDDLEVPSESKNPTLEMVSLDVRPPAHFVVGHTPISKRIDHRRLIKANRHRRLWLAGSVFAVIVAGLSLILVSAGTDKPTPRASAAPTTRSHSVAPQPLERPTVAADPVEPAVETPPPAKRSSKRSKKDDKRDAKPAPAKKWDPDALFPQ
jgi:hypothetical protein